MFVGLASVIGIGLPRRLASWVAARSNQSSSWSSRYRMALGKSFGRAVRREAARSPHLRVVGRRTAEPLGRKQVGRLVLNGIAAHAEDIAALGIVRQSRNLAIGAEQYLYDPVRRISAAMRLQIVSTANAAFFAFSFKQILATKSRPFHLEIIRCLESQSAARGHHPTSAH